MICLTVFNNFPGKAGLEQLLVAKVSYKCVSLWVPAFHLSLPVIQKHKETHQKEEPEVLVTT